MLSVTDIIQSLDNGEISQEQALDLLEKVKTGRAVSSKIPRASSSQQSNSLVSSIKRYLSGKLQTILAIEANEISRDENLMALGVDSVQLIALTQEIEAEVGIELYPTLFFEYQTIDTVSTFMAEVFPAEFALFLNIEIEQVKQPVLFPADEEAGPTPSFEPAFRERQTPLLSTNLRQPEQKPTNDIAIIGMAGIFPQSPDVATFWQHLYQKTDLITEIPEDHFDYHPWYDPTFQVEDKLYCKWGSFIDNVDKFDAGFFNISPREAELMDPQLRHLLQILVHTAEDAGYGAVIRGSHTGVYVGACFHDYTDEMIRQGKTVQAHDATGTAATMLANRPSFYFDLTGPSLAIDTACSSSLVALHYACRALQNDECEMAFAAGVNLLLSSRHYRYFCNLGALSPTGRCHTFDERADGYVPGEAIAAVLLKPLSQAVEDGDQIYGIIKGSAVGHGGYTPSITAPSVDGEAKVLLAAWQAAGINPETLGYIEAHGTGTKLGDPIEIAALNKAFRSHTTKEGFCGIGSAKAHLGHTEGAAGIVGVIKALLAIRHGIIPAMPQFERLNPYIQLEQSPFYINPKPVEWSREAGSPRRAGVSSFGFGGANAHVVLEAYQEVRGKEQDLEEGPQLIVLSAGNEAGLRAYVQKLLAFLEQTSNSTLTEPKFNREKHLPALSLVSIAYTLQVGREALAARLALVVSSVEELIERLRQYKQKQIAIERLYQGHTKGGHLNAGLLIGGETETTFIRTAIRNRELDRLAQLWVSGVELEWGLLYPSPPPRRVSLPTYPFAGERYWLPYPEPRTTNANGLGRIEMLHPLIHKNTSTLTQQRFSSVFSGTELFLADHQVQGEKVLPGVAYLEVARAAGAIALEDGSITQLKDVVWIKPLVVKDEPLEAQIALYPGERDEIAFEVSSHGLVHSQGKLVVGEVSRPDPLDIRALEARCGSKIEGPDCYQWFKEHGLEYGPAFQGVAQISYNEQEALARLRLPAAADGEGYDLHPSVLDAALQATLGLAISQNAPGHNRVYLPFAVQTVTIYQALPENAYAHVQYSHGVEPDDDMINYDITVTDDQGAICVTLKGFTVRARSEPATNEVLFSTPAWQVKPLADDDDRADAEPKATTLLLVGLEQDFVEAIAKTFNQVEVVELDPANVTALIQQGWQQLKAIIDQKPKTTHHVLVVAADTVEHHRVAPLAGLLKTARLEQPHIRGKVIAVSNPATSHLMALLGREMRANTFADVDIRYDEAGTRSVKILREIKATHQVKPAYLKPGGVYWITGGLGGLGRIFARHLLDQDETITVILSGRSALDETGQQRLAELNQLGGTVAYLPVDVSMQAEVKRMVHTITTEYGPLNGIIHSAGVISDSLILNKTAAEIETVLAPKVSGLLNIDAATRTEALDFVVLFSSLTGVLGNLGQADYAAANAFLDGFVHHRQALVEAGQRSGRTVSINWPLWAKGGMTLAPDMEKWVADRTGLKPLSTGQGLKAFDHVLAQDEYDQLLVAPGDQAKIRHSLGLAPGNRATQRPGPLDSQVTGEVKEQVKNALIELCVALLKVDQVDLDIDTNFAEYGVDSILMMSMLNKLEELYGIAVAPMAIAEHPTIRALAGYLIGEGVTGPQASAPQPRAKAIDLNGSESKSAAKRSTLTTKRKNRFRYRTDRNRSGKVAIIGQACRLPQSPTPERFWDNLAAGRNLVTPVPADRWQVEAFYSDQSNQAGKTYSNHGAFIDGIGYFDAGYFGIADEEAITMDPQQRIILELAQELWDRAGYRAEEVAGTNTSIFIGAKDNNYVRNYYHLIPQAVVQHTIVNTISNMIAARVSDYYNLTGTAQVIDTACSSSLVAVHDACRSLLSGESELAIAGGIFLMVDAFSHVGFSQARVLSADGTSYVFDERANGFVLGEGGGLVLLKEYEAALRDGDQILGVILGSAVNNDGHTMGLTVPNQAGQKAVIETALRRSHLSPTDIGYLEAHGTGTLLGDPIEIRAATEAYRHYTQEKQYCAVGSVKSNLGHTMTAAGIIGLIKLVLSLEHQQIPATLHCEKPHPRFKFEDSPFYPNTHLRDWAPRNERWIGAISSFGFGGTNCHLIVEEGHQAHPIRQRLPLTQFRRKRYWLGQEIVPDDTGGRDRVYYEKLLDQFIGGELSEQEVEALIKV